MMANGRCGSTAHLWKNTIPLCPAHYQLAMQCMRIRKYSDTLFRRSRSGRTYEDAPCNDIGGALSLHVETTTESLVSKEEQVCL